MTRHWPYLGVCKFRRPLDETPLFFNFYGTILDPLFLTPSDLGICSPVFQGYGF